MTRREQRGSVLVVALWVVIILSMIVSSFAFDMQVEARITSYYRKRLKAGYLARGGIERARMLLVRSADEDISEEDSYEDSDKWWYPYAKSLSLGGPVYNVTEDLTNGAIAVSIVPEPALRNVNLLTRDDWERVLEIGGVPEAQWEELIDAFLDWTDNDNGVRPYGAETEDYYATLDPPYEAKNSLLFTVDEMLLIKGFIPPILYGGLPEDADEDEIPMVGIKDLLTVYGEDHVNVNAANESVLMTLPDVDFEQASEIILEREGFGEEDEREPFEDKDDFFSRVSSLNRGSLDKKVSTSSKIYRITAVGTSHGVTRKISCIVEVQENGLLKILRWIESEGA